MTEPPQVIDPGIAIAMVTECIEGGRPSIAVAAEYAATYGADYVAWLLLFVTQLAVRTAFTTDEDAMVAVRHFAAGLCRLEADPPR